MHATNIAEATNTGSLRYPLSNNRPRKRPGAYIIAFYHNVSEDHAVDVGEDHGPVWILSKRYNVTAVSAPAQQHVRPLVTYMLEADWSGRTTSW